MNIFLLLSQLMCELGNGVINQIYEARREELGARKPQPGDPRYMIADEKTLETDKQMLILSLSLCFIAFSVFFFI